ncbi:hypothetical protein [Pseudohongiella nitratireducens]|uniref:hypothetical protein n=1 Tax=Pseudohongiella nitratireducens TaxID=1768907 RepID=UPI0030EF63A0|tara:strand:+ start:2131 stop:3009 length:879 start_codon:yes stop_codon:yes gene_type:complete
MLPFAYSRHSHSEFSASGQAGINGSDNSQGNLQTATVLDSVLDRESAAVVRYCTDQGWGSPQWQVEKSADWRSGFSDRLDEPEGDEESRANQNPVDHNSVDHNSVDHNPDDQNPGKQRPGENILAGKPVWVPPVSSDIVIYSLQRMFNSARDLDLTLAWMRDRDMTLHVVALNAEISQTRTFTRTKVDFDYILREMLALEVRRGAERMKRVKQKQRQKGRFLGGSKPFGYMVHSNGKLIENPLEQKVLRQIHQLRQRGYSLRDIARQVSTPVAPVSFKTVQRILKRSGESNV